MDNNNDEIWVFLSHSHKDYEKVLKVRDLLEKDSFRPIMFFLRCLENEDEVDNLIKREIDSRKRFILCDSENARESRWVQREVEYIKSRDRVFETVDLDDSIENIAETLRRFRTRSTVFIKGFSNVNLAGILYDELKKEEYRVYNVFGEKDKLLKKYEDKKAAFLGHSIPLGRFRGSFYSMIKQMANSYYLRRKSTIIELLEDLKIYDEIGEKQFERFEDSRFNEEIIAKIFERLEDSTLDEVTKNKLLELLRRIKINNSDKLLGIINDLKIDEDTRKILLTIINPSRLHEELNNLKQQEAAELEEIKKIADDYLQKSSEDGYVIHLISNKELRKDRKRLEKTLFNLEDNDIVVAVDDLFDNLSKKIRKVLEDHTLLEVHGLSVEDKAKKIVSYLKDLDIRLFGEKKTM